MAIELIENSELGALAPSRLGNNFIGDDEYSNFNPALEIETTAISQLNNLKNQYDSQVNNAVTKGQPNDLVFLNNLFIELRNKAIQYSMIPSNYGKGLYVAYTRYGTDLAPKVDLIKASNRNWWINDINGKDCDYVIQRTKVLADTIGIVAKMETDAGANSDGSVSRLFKEVFDNNYTPAIKNLKCEEKAKAQEDATSDIQRIKSEREKAKSNEEAILKAIQDAKSISLTTPEIKTQKPATSTNTKLIFGVALGVLATFLIMRK